MPTSFYNYHLTAGLRETLIASGPIGLNRGWGDHLGGLVVIAHSLYLHNLPFANQRRLPIPKIYLITQPVRLLDDCLNYGIDDLAAVHGDADVVADFGFMWLS
jgi:hypothetical protein